jgi:exonuclease VII small subunit
MSEISEKKLNFSISALILFLDGTAKSKKLTVSFVDKCKKKCAVLLGKIGEEEEREEIVESLNEVIKEINKNLDKEYPPYPNLDFQPTRYAIQGNILAFEHYLTQKLEEKKIDLEDQIPIFKRAMTIWGQVGEELSEEEGEQEFSELIEETNAFLKELDHYPHPEE